MLHQFMLSLLALPRVQKSLLLMFIDMLILPLALLSAFCLRYSDMELIVHTNDHLWLFVWVLIFGPLLFLKLGLYRAVVRYIGWDALWSIVLAVVALSITLYPVSWMANNVHMPLSVPLIFAVVAMLYVGGSRALARQYYKHAIARDNPRKKAIIYGAGSTGMQLMQALHITNAYAILAFIDDDATKWRSNIRGVKVKPPAELVTLLETKAVDVVLLAMPSASASQRKRVLDQLANYPVLVQTVPAMTDILTGKAQLDSLREIEIEDLLGRDAVTAQSELLGKNITNKAVMVTGAGGSIGSELCRQIAQQHPSCLVLFEMSEFALYAIHQELSQQYPSLALYPVLGTVLDGEHGQVIMRRFRIQTLYHAAAYKHVPLVEHNIVEGVRNNALGTQTLAQAALAQGVSHFVLISTDKAVRPTNVMGASKRLAEQVLQDLAKHSTTTLFTMVRFGNVLGSSGSVVPVFRRQLAQGGPIKVTHADITRYFMTIPEAASLVIQAGALAKGGDVFVLDMGEPVKIVDLAKRMIYLSGLEVKDVDHPQGDIEIEFTGLRPGEKLYEELLIDAEVLPTEHAKIARAQDGCCASEQLHAGMQSLALAIEQQSPAQVRDLLTRLVPEFKPVSECVDWRRCKNDAFDSVD